MAIHRLTLSLALFAWTAIFVTYPVDGFAQTSDPDPDATDSTPRFWNPEGKESPEPYGYDVYTAPEVPLGYVDPDDPPATLILPSHNQSGSVLTVDTDIDRTSYSWYGAATVTAEIRHEGDLVTDCDSVLVISAANPRVSARLQDDGVGSDVAAGDGVYSGVFDIGAGEGESRPTGNYTVTATAYRDADWGSDNSSSFSVYSVRRWTGITTTNLTDSADRYTAFYVTPNGDGTYHHEIRDFGLVRSSSVSNAQIRIPVFPAVNEISGLTVVGSGVSNVSSIDNLITFDCNLTSGNVKRVTIEFDSPSDLAATRIDRYQTGDIGLRNFRNGYLIWNRFYHTAILGSSFTSPHGPGCIVDHHLTDLGTGDPHTIDCMERVAVHLDNSGLNDGTGTYPSNIKWDDDALSWLQSADLNSFVFRFESGGNYGRADDVFVERHVEFYAEQRSFRHHYRMENIDNVAHDFDFVWGREQWLYGGSSNRQNGDRGILPNDATNHGGELRTTPIPGLGTWFAAFDLSTFYSIGVLIPEDTDVALPTYVHMLCNPAISANSTGEYPINPSGSCSNMENLFFEKQIGILTPGESAEYEFYQWGGYGSDRADLTAILWEDADDVLLDPASTGPMSTDDMPSTGLALRAISPNPMVLEAEITFELPVASSTSLAIFDISGRRVTTLVDQPLPAGNHVARWDGKSDNGIILAKGIYFLRLQAGGQTASRKVTIEGR